MKYQLDTSVEIIFPDKTFSSTLFEKRVFSNVDFSRVDLFECKFSKCEFNLANLRDAMLRDVVFEDCKLVGADFSHLRQQFLEMRFENCVLDTCNLSGLKLRRASFAKSTLRDVRCVGCEFVEANFQETDLERTLFRDCHLERADFTRARNYSIDPTSNRLVGASFSFPEAMGLLQGFGVRIVM